MNLSDSLAQELLLLIGELPAYDELGGYNDPTGRYDIIGHPDSIAALLSCPGKGRLTFYPPNNAPKDAVALFMDCWLFGSPTHPRNGLVIRYIGSAIGDVLIDNVDNVIPKSNA